MSILDQIKNKFIMENAWEDWKDYRTQLTDMILEINPSSVMIVGAGRCNDIDLSGLLQKVQKVILLDINQKAMDSAVDGKAICRAISLTGISEEDTEFFCEDMLSFVRAEGRNLTLDNFRAKLMSSMDRLSESLYKDERSLFESLQGNTVEVIVCSGVHSQLFSMLHFFIRSLIGSLGDIFTDTEELEQEIFRRIQEMDDHIIPIINSALYSTASKAVLFGNEYMPERPVEGAHQCIVNVRENTWPVEKHLEWNFNPAAGITYDMLIQICRKQPESLS
ncbi:MAG: hypothetical protein K6C35_03545 [Eubacterium sp.]|nr:hypothetical protein [Eubacterium sp.]